ncbi:hypothetical protein [Saccharopolyspora shandongensis]|uniref:hypothetical protein n=1 Tax=Saccharopolyspora shandongensis TaxID=418495 RepID=UPI00340848F1
MSATPGRRAGFGAVSWPFRQFVQPEANRERLLRNEFAGDVSQILIPERLGEAVGEQRHRLVQVDDPVVPGRRVGVLAGLDHVVGAPSSAYSATVSKRWGSWGTAVMTTPHRTDFGDY